MQFPLGSQVEQQPYQIGEFIHAEAADLQEGTELVHTRQGKSHKTGGAAGT